MNKRVVSYMRKIVTMSNPCRDRCVLLLLQVKLLTVFASTEAPSGRLQGRRPFGRSCLLSDKLLENQTSICRVFGPTDKKKIRGSHQREQCGNCR